MFSFQSLHVSVVAFLNAHPSATGPVAMVILWWLFCSVSVSVMDRWVPKTDDQWSLLYAQRPRLAAALNMTKTFGFSVPKFFVWARAFVSRRTPPLLNVPRTAEELQTLKAIVEAQILAFQAAKDAPAPAPPPPIADITPPAPPKMPNPPFKLP